MFMVNDLTWISSKNKSWQRGVLAAKDNSGKIGKKMDLGGRFL